MSAEEKPGPEPVEVEPGGFSRWWLAAAAVFFLALFGWSELRVRAEREKTSEVEATANRLGVENNRLERSESSTLSRTWDLAPEAAAPDASGHVFVDAASGRIFAFCFGLPDAPAGATYRLWLLTGGSPVGSMVLDKSSTSNAWYGTAGLPEAGIKGAVVTMETARDPASPSTDVVLRSK